MAWMWVAELTPGAEAIRDDLIGVGVGGGFESQAAAEAWLTSTFEDLADLGVSEVSLFEEDRLVYGPMSLLPE